jgi:hypothetical protein
MSRVPEFNDGIFAEATETLVELCRQIEEETGDKPTLEELCELLAWGLRSCSADILKDVNPRNIVDLKAKVKKTVCLRLRPGDLVAIPSRKGRCYLAVVITGNRFGWAYGILKGEHTLKPPPSDWIGEPFQIPIYSGDRYAADGRWPVLGNYPHLLRLFPTEPEIYHEKRNHPDNPAIGEFGAAENARNELRKITREEAEKIGLLSGTYRQCLLEDELKIHLSKQLGQP